MQSIFLLAVLLLLASPCSCGWDEPISLEGEHTMCELGKSAYRDPSTGTLHLICDEVYSDDEVAYLGTLRVYPNKTCDYMRYLYKDFWLSWTAVPGIDGAGDGKHLFVQVSRSRISHKLPGDYACSEQDTSDCHDVYFQESNNSGESWSPPAQIISRSNMSDAYLRGAYAPLYIKETGRLYLFYTLLKHRGVGTDAIGYITRPADSKVFSPERLVITGRTEYISPVGAVYTYKDRRAMIHLVWVDYNEDLMYSSSVDTYVWKTPVVLCKASKGLYIPVISNTSISNNIFVFYINSSTVEMLISKDEGTTWSAPIEVAKAGAYHFIGTAYCGNQGNEFVFVVATFGWGNFAMYDVKRNKLTKLEAPFRGKAFNNPHIICTFNSVNVTVSVVANAIQYSSTYMNSMNITLPTGETQE